MNREGDEKLKRDIGLLGAAFLALNGIVGAGIYALPAELVGATGAFSPWLFPIFGLLMLTVVLVFAELASYFDTSGGPIVYADAAFGPLVGFQTGWVLYVARLTGFAANANIFVAYLAAFYPSLAEGVPRAAVLALLLGALTFVNVIGVKQAIRTLNVITFLKIVPLLILVAWGLTRMAGAPAQRVELPTFEDLGGVTLLLLYAFVGFESATITAGETRAARNSVPRALILTTIGTTTLYFLIQLVYVAITRGQPIESAPLVEAGRILAGEAGAIAITIAAIFSIGGNLAGSAISGPRMTLALAETNTLPAWFGRVSARFATPKNSILFYGLVSIVLAISGAFVILAVVSSLARMFVYVLCAAALPILRRRFGSEQARPSGRQTLRIVAPIVAVITCVYAMSTATPEAWWWLLGLMAAGGAFFLMNRALRPA